MMDHISVSIVLNSMQRNEVTQLLPTEMLSTTVVLADSVTDGYGYHIQLA